MTEAASHRERHGSDLHDELTVSVIVPTFHDWERLGVCLQALGAQTYPAHLIEVIVVNNDPSDVPPESLSLGKNVRLFSEEKAGSYAARNTGVSAASGNVLAFTDSDCIPDEEWLATGVDRLRNGAERVAGRVAMFAPSEQPTLADEYEILVAFDQERYASLGTSATANMITWSHHFTRVGAFDGSLLSGGDMEWGMRAQHLGVSIAYAPECVVRHPTRASLRALFAKARRVSSGHATTRALDRQRYSLLRSFLPPKTVLRVLRAPRPSLARRLQIAALAYALKLWSTLHAGLIGANITAPRRG